MPSSSPSALVRFRYELTTSFGLAMASIRAHKLRSFLTLLGVIIGVASVILVGAAIEGLGVYAKNSVSKAFGSDSYLVARVAQVGNMDRKEFFEKLRRHKLIRNADLDYLNQTTGESILYTPYLQRMDTVSAGSNKIEEAAIIGAAAMLAEIRDVALGDGRFFTPQEEESQFVAVIGLDIANELFPVGSALNRHVRIKGFEFTVIGVQQKLGTAFGRSLDTSVYIPLKAYTRLYGTPDSISIFGRPRPESGLSLEDALDITRVALRTRYNTRPGEPDRFDTLTPDGIRGFIDQVLGMIAVVVVPVTSISLVVGGIVIMNIMLVSVTERTREIGLRKSLGARRSDIMLQFLLEAVVLSAVGGALGIGLGAALAAIGTRAFGVTLAVTLPYVVLALVVSTTVGVASGWYPASRAARLDPVEALRAE